MKSVSTACSKCGGEKSNTNAYCKDCRKQYDANNYDARKQRSKYLKYAHKISIEEYERLLESQLGLCACCGTTDPGGVRHSVFSVDHCHQTGVVRGLLCNGCNSGVKLTDSPDLLVKKVIYLRKYGKMLSSGVMKDFLS